jgi:hypothetical protein
VYPQHAAWAGTGNADAAEKLVKVYGASLELPTKDGRTALQIAKEQKQTSTEQKLLLLTAKAAAERAAAAQALAAEAVAGAELAAAAAPQVHAPKDAKRKPESSPEPSTSKKAKLAEATEETGDVFGVWPTPMTGGDDKWSQFLSLLKPEIAALTSILGKSDLFKVASVLRTAVRIFDGRNKLTQWETAETKKWKEANSEADVQADATAKALLQTHLKDNAPEALKVRKRLLFLLCRYYGLVARTVAHGCSQDFAKGGYFTSAVMDTKLKKSEEFTSDGALKTLAVLEAITKRTAKVNEEKKQREAAASRDELTEWISKLSSAKRSSEEALKPLTAQQRAAKDTTKDLDKQIASAAASMANNHVTEANTDMDRQFDLLNKLHRLTNEKKVETVRLEGLTDQVKTLEAQVADADAKMRTLEIKLAKLKA